MSNRKKILWVDDDLFYIQPYVESLEEEGYEVANAKTFTEAKNRLAGNDVDVIITDIMLPTRNENEEKELELEIETRGGHETGIALARWIKKKYPQLPIIGLSVRTDKQTSERFMHYGMDYKTKYELRDVSNFVQYINGIFLPQQLKHLKIFIVHGQDGATKFELKNFIQNNLKLGEPVILHERPSLGRTILEKFEEEASDVDVVFVLLTPDDKVYDSSTPDNIKRRARQNVILELGYFLAKLERRKGRILLLYKGELDLPSDITGLGYIDISNGIESAGEDIRRELANFL